MYLIANISFAIESTKGKNITQLLSLTLFLCTRILPLFFIQRYSKVPLNELSILFQLNIVFHITQQTLNDFLKDRKQRLVLNWQNSSWANVEVGVPQGSILSPLLFSISISYLPGNLLTNAKLFADDTSVFCSSRCHYFFLRLEL